MRVAIRLVLFVLVTVLLAPASTTGQQPVTRQPVTIPRDGFDLFRALLDREGIRPVAREEFERNFLQGFNDLIVIILGDPRSARRADPMWVARQVVQNGGAALIATDSELHYLGPTGTTGWITGNRLECDRNNAYHRYPDCPYVIPLSPQVFRDGLAPQMPIEAVFRDLDRIATNSPSYLAVDTWTDELRYPLARFPARSVLSGFNRQLLPANTLFAVGGEGPSENLRRSYQFILMADHSVFINQMLLEPGTDNLELTYRVIDFLRQPNPANPRESIRKRCLFIENGQVVERFDGLRQAFKQGLPLPQVNLWGIQDKLVDLGNAVIDDVQNRDLPNKLFVGGFGLPAIMRFLLLILTVVGTLVILNRLRGSRQPQDLPPSPSVPGAPSGPPGVFDRRQRELLRRDNVYEPVRDLVREFFVSIGVHGEPGPKPPPVVIASVIRKPESLRKAIKDFWKLAYGPPEVLKVNQWREMEPYFERLRQAHADGKWRFEFEEATTRSV